MSKRMSKFLWLFVALLVLASCAPTIREAGAAETLKLEGKTLTLGMPAPIVHGSGAILGKVSSRFCAGKSTEKPRVCPQRESGWTALDIPVMEYSQRLVVGTVQGPVRDGFFDVALQGYRVTVRAELER